MDREKLDVISKQILDASIEVHKQLGPGLLESVYEICLYKDLRNRNLFVQRQVVLPVKYKNEALELDFRLDLLVVEEIIIELKAVEILLPVHEAQLITYLKLADKPLGFLINFNVPKLVDGFKRRVNNF
ncbi:GxxExxY protein [Bacteroidetes bacterium UKL13-3]|jgi:GxxExxY protein|nr:GxxExxY protein [Bacteroidetes bacterium UKL13-3]HCP94063.1 GxxExxY protein [Bacteroidota bacterium]